MITRSETPSRLCRHSNDIFQQQRAITLSVSSYTTSQDVTVRRRHQTENSLLGLSADTRQNTSIVCPRFPCSAPISDSFIAIVKIIKANPNTAFALIIEPDSLPNLITNSAVAACQQSAAGYREGVAYALRSLNLPNVALYLDAGHGGWLGWNDNLGEILPFLYLTFTYESFTLSSWRPGTSKCICRCRKALPTARDCHKRRWMERLDQDAWRV